jgi:NFU1 iron-sulfur cluster scaffold homolog, mitochondrial
MFIQTEVTPNPNSLKFLPGKNVSNRGSFEVTKKEETESNLVKNLLSINGVTGVFLGADFLSINKNEETAWEDIKHIAISLINEFYETGKEFIIANELFSEKNNELNEIEKQIISILETKIRPAVAKDGGDIKFKEFKNGVVKVELQGSCSGCPSSTMTLKQGVQNLLCHYLPEVKEVVAI